MDRSWAFILLVSFTICGSTLYSLLPAFESLHGTVAKSRDEHSQGKRGLRKELEMMLENIYQIGLEPSKEMLISK
jgi:hypothetical protein